jgi:hypothetical protein
VVKFRIGVELTAQDKYLKQALTQQAKSLLLFPAIFATKLELRRM